MTIYFVDDNNKEVFNESIYDAFAISVAIFMLSSLRNCIIYSLRNREYRASSRKILRDVKSKLCSFCCHSSFTRSWIFFGLVDWYLFERLWVFLVAYSRGGQTFHTKGHVGKNFEAEGHTTKRAKKSLIISTDKKKVVTSAVVLQFTQCR